jgi:hypothetical protein
MLTIARILPSIQHKIADLNLLVWLPARGLVGPQWSAINARPVGAAQIHDRYLITRYFQLQMMSRDIGVLDRDLIVLAATQHKLTVR